MNEFMQKELNKLTEGDLNEIAAEVAIRVVGEMGEVLKESGKLSRAVHIGWNRDNLELLLDVNNDTVRLKMPKITDLIRKFNKKAE